MVTDVAIDYGAGISDAWSSIAKFVPKLAAFLIILIIGWIIAKVLAKVVTVILQKVGFDRLADRSGISSALAKSDYDASSLLAKVVYYAILLITLQLAIGAFGPNPISDLLTRFVAWLPKLFVAIIIIVIAAAIAQAVREIIRSALSGASYGPLVATIASVFILGAGIIAALNQIGVATTVTTPILVAVLATIGGVIVVGVGGGLVKPMQSRWETALDKVAEEIPARRAEREQAHAARRHAQPTAYTQQQPAQQMPTQGFTSPTPPPHPGQPYQQPGQPYEQPGQPYEQPGYPNDGRPAQEFPPRDYGGGYQQPPQ